MIKITGVTHYLILKLSAIGWQVIEPHIIAIGPFDDEPTARDWCSNWETRLPEIMDLDCESIEIQELVPEPPQQVASRFFSYSKYSSEQTLEEVIKHRKNKIGQDARTQSY